jgi:hypothetical protein
MTTLRSQSVVLDRVSKSFDDVAALDDISLEIGSGEFSRCSGRLEGRAARSRRSSSGMGASIAK